MMEKCFCLAAKIQIRPVDEGISVFAPSLGLHEVYFDKNSWKVNAPVTMDTYYRTLKHVGVYHRVDVISDLPT